MGIFKNMFKKGEKSDNTLVIVHNTEQTIHQPASVENIVVEPETETILQTSQTATPDIRLRKPVISQDEPGKETDAAPVVGPVVIVDETEPQEPIEPKAYKPVLPKPSSPHVEQYTLVSPRNCFINYDLFQYCEMVPVAYEQSTDSDFNECVQLPTQVFLGYLNALKYASDEVINNPLNRTISIVHLLNNQNLYILPNLKQPKRPICVRPHGGLGLNTTPAIKAAIVEQLKMYTRGGN